MAEPCWATRATMPDGALGTPVKRDETNSGTSGSAGRGRGQGARARWTLGEWSAGHRVGFDLGGYFDEPAFSRLIYETSMHFAI